MIRLIYAPVYIWDKKLGNSNKFPISIPDVIASESSLVGKRYEVLHDIDRVRRGVRFIILLCYSCSRVESKIDTVSR